MVRFLIYHNFALRFEGCPVKSADSSMIVECRVVIVWDARVVTTSHRQKKIMNRRAHSYLRENGAEALTYFIHAHDLSEACMYVSFRYTLYQYRTHPSPALGLNDPLRPALSLYYTTTYDQSPLSTRGPNVLESEPHPPPFLCFF